MYFKKGTAAEFPLCRCRIYFRHVFFILKGTEQFFYFKYSMCFANTSAFKILYMGKQRTSIIRPKISVSLYVYTCRTDRPVLSYREFLRYTGVKAGCTLTDPR